MKTTKEEKSKEKPAMLEKLVLNITAPIKMDQEIELSKIAVLVGPNSTGKSLLLKIAYALGSVGVSQGWPHMDAIQKTQFIFDNTFKEQNFDGSLKAIYTKGSVTVELDKGKVTKAEISDLEKPVPIVFMSSDLRTFDAMSMYLRVRKASGSDLLKRMEALLQAYRLYDVTYMESLIRRCPIAIPERLQSILKGQFDFKESITTIGADLDKCTFVAYAADNTKKDIATYGKGHQAILNMFVASGL